MRILTPLALALTLAAGVVTCAQAARRQAATELTIKVWPQGQDDLSKTWTLRCGPTGGTLPNRAAACRRLAAMDDPFKPVPRRAICTQIYGGPEVAVVHGHLGERRIYAMFRRRNGCEIDRWKRHGFLLQTGSS